MDPLAIAAAALVVASVLVGERLQAATGAPADRVTVRVIDAWPKRSSAEQRAEKRRALHPTSTRAEVPCRRGAHCARTSPHRAVPDIFLADTTARWLPVRVPLVVGLLDCSQAECLAEVARHSSKELTNRGNLPAGRPG